MNNKIFNNGLSDLEKRFGNPGIEFRGKPFWSWNGELKKEELLRQVDILKEMGFGGYFMHSRSGLITEYLGEEWFDLCNSVSDYGESVGMESWLYDEDRWPSGSAGGIVTRDPQYRQKSLFVYNMKPELFKRSDDTFCAFKAKFDGDGTLVSYEKFEGDTCENAAEGEKILEYRIVYAKPDSNYNGTTYIDTMSYAAVQKFIEITHEQYKEKCGERIGREIRGIFTDEPNRGYLLDNMKTDENGTVSCAVFYTDDIFEEFEKRYGYDAKALLPELFYEMPQSEISYIAKHDWIDLGCNLFVERFAMPINNWCKEHNIDFTGHVLHENSLMNQTIPNGSLMRFYEHMGMPGIDLLCEYGKDFWVAKQIQSVSRQLDKKWVLSELYGCTGWQFNFKGHKSQGDWQALFGVNVRCPHLSWYTMEGEAKRDYPASILHQASYYRDYSFVEDYYARFGTMMAEGEAACDILVINSIESLWLDMKVDWAHWIVSNNAKSSAREAHYNQLFMYLTQGHFDFDYGEEQMMAQHGSVELECGVPVLRIGKMTYSTVIVSGMETIRSSTMKLLEDFAKLGGTIIVSGDAPTRTDAKLTNDFSVFKEKYNDNVIQVPFEKEALLGSVKAVMDKWSSPYAEISGENNENLFCQLRFCEEDGIYTFAVINVDNYKEATAHITLKNCLGTALTQWVLESGERKNLDDTCTFYDDDIVFDFPMQPTGSAVFTISTDKEHIPERKDFRRGTQKAIEVKLPEEFDYELDEKNVMVLDFASAEFNGKHFDTTEILQLDREIRDTVGIEKRGGDMLQPWYAKKYANDSYGDLKFVYEFEVEEIPTTPVVFAAERPEFITYMLNGEKLTADGGFWIDECFKTMQIPAGLLKKGMNRIEAFTEFKRTTNLEAAYLVGDFGVKLNAVELNPGTRLDDKGSKYDRHGKMVKLPEKLNLGELAQQNLPFFTGVVSYKVPASVFDGIELAEGQKVVLRVAAYTGSLMKITDNDGNNKQIMAWDPYKADVTDYIKTGFKICLVCSRRNMFGPLHISPAVPGAIGPWDFVNIKTQDYVFMDSNPGKWTFNIIDN